MSELISLKGFENLWSQQYVRKEKGMINLWQTHIEHVSVQTMVAATYRTCHCANHGTEFSVYLSCRLPWLSFRLAFFPFSLDHVTYLFVFYLFQIIFNSSYNEYHQVPCVHYPIALQWHENACKMSKTLSETNDRLN